MICYEIGRERGDPLKPNAGVSELMLSASEIRSLCGEIDDWKILAISALLPTRNDVETAVAWADRRDEVCEEQSLTGKSAQIFDILATDVPDEEER